MANNYEVVTLVSSLPNACVKDEHLLLLGLVGFCAEKGHEDTYLYTPAETGANTVFLSDYSDSSFDEAWKAMLEDAGLSPFAHTPSVVELRIRLADCSPVDWDQEAAVDWTDVVQIVLRDMPQDVVSHLDFQGGYWCDKERPGEFGGYALRVARNAIHSNENPGQFFSRLDKPCTAPMTPMSDDAREALERSAAALRDLHNGYPWKELSEPVEVTLARFERLGIGDEGRVEHEVSQSPAGTSRSNADPAALAQALRDQGCAVAVFQPADVPDDVDDPQAWLQVHARAIEDAMVRAGNEAIEDLNVQLGLPTPGGY